MKVLKRFVSRIAWRVSVLGRRPSGLLSILLTLVAIGLVTALMVTPSSRDARPSRGRGERVDTLFIAPRDAPREVTVGRAHLLLKKDARIRVSRPRDLDIGNKLHDGGVPDDPEEVGSSGYQGVGCFARPRMNGGGGESAGGGAGFSIGDLLEVFLQRGGLNATMEGVSDGDLLRINTPNGSVEARNASFEVVFGHLDTLVSVQYGSVAVSGYSGVPLIVNAGSLARIEGGAPPRLLLPGDDRVIPARVPLASISAEPYFTGSGIGKVRDPAPIERREPEITTNAENGNPDPEGPAEHVIAPKQTTPQTIAPKPIDPVNPQPRSYP